MNCPPLPPNSDREMFWVRDGIAYMHGGQFEVRVEALTGDERYFASCIARCMWLDIAKVAGDTIGGAEAYLAALASAEAWRKWGARLDEAETEARP